MPDARSRRDPLFCSPGGTVRLRFEDTASDGLCIRRSDITRNHALGDLAPPRMRTGIPR